MRKWASLDNGVPNPTGHPLPCHRCSLWPVVSSRHHPDGLSCWCFRFLYTDFVNKLCLLPLKGGWLPSCVRDSGGALFIYLFSFRGGEKDIQCEIMEMREDCSELSQPCRASQLAQNLVFLSTVLPEVLNHILFFISARKNFGYIYSLLTTLKIDQ